MNEARVREIIREVISELYNGNHNAYPLIPTHFPYGDGETPMTPEDINTDIDNSNVKMPITDNWTQKEFDLGISIEKKKSPALQDHSHIVTKNLEGDSKFYSKLTKLSKDK